MYSVYTGYGQDGGYGSIGKGKVGVLSINGHSSKIPLVSRETMTAQSGHLHNRGDLSAIRTECDAIEKHIRRAVSTPDHHTRCLSKVMECGGQSSIFPSHRLNQSNLQRK
ncbi:hypothetical protein Ddc_00775 [Ditylenchus destructor]|nr:hypothetical protein Ddc_00775 [Ditylenchus destructor]